MPHTALLVIDAQRAFENGPEWGNTDTTDWLSQQKKLIEHASTNNWPIAAVIHHSRYHFDPSGTGVEPVAGLALPEGTPRFIKHVHTALASEGITQWLSAHAISRLVISGIRTEQCCETTARAARDAGYEVDFVLDATLTFAMPSPDGTTMSADEIKQHTATVLHRRFATVQNLDSLVSSTQPDTLNRHCPRSGAPVSADSITQYRGIDVGFCNPGCRDGFAQDPDACPADRRHFDRLIALQAGER